MKCDIQIKETSELVKFMFAGHSIFSLYQVGTKSTMNLRFRKIRFARKWLYELSCCFGEHFQEHNFVPVLGYDLQNDKYYGNKRAEDLPLDVRKRFVEAVKWVIIMGTCLNDFNPVEYLLFRGNTCQRCGKALEEKESIDRGYGSECFNKINKNPFWWQKNMF